MKKNSGNSGFVRAWKMFPDSGNSGDLGDGRAGCTAANSSTQQPDGYPSYYCDNYTEHMEQIMDEWEKRGFSPDGIYTGFLADEEQADKILDFLRRFRKEKTMVLVDPVMGDNGSAYGIYTEGLREKMLQLVGKAAKLKYRSICLPLGLARLAAPYYERRSLRERKPLFFTPYSVSVLASNGQFSHAAASERFAYQPRPIEETLGDMTAWLLNQK